MYIKRINFSKKKLFPTKISAPYTQTSANKLFFWKNKFFFAVFGDVEKSQAKQDDGDGKGTMPL